MTLATWSLTLSQYDQLSRLTSETRYFAAPLNRTYTLNYGYNLANVLTSVGLPDWSQQVNYNHDAVGRLNSVTSSGFVDTAYQGTYPNWYPYPTQVTTFASNITYRASGAVKQMTFGNGAQLTMNYNARQAATRFEISNLNNGSGGTHSVGDTYDYYDDGRIRFIGDLFDNHFDRKYTYDHTARLQEALSGNEARGGTSADGPYRENYAKLYSIEITGRVA